MENFFFRKLLKLTATDFFLQVNELTVKSQSYKKNPIHWTFQKQHPFLKGFIRKQLNFVKFFFASPD